MSIHEIEKQIVIKIISHYQNFDKAVLGITGYTLAEVTGFSFPLQYFKDNLVLNLPPNISISDDIKILLNAMFKEGKKTNKGTLTIYPNGEYESSFIWDEAADLENLALAVWQTIDYWGNEFLFNYLFDFHPDWQKAVVKSYIKDNNVIFQIISLNEKAILVGIEIPEQMQTDYIAWQEYCVNGKVKPLFIPWNGIIFNLDASKWFYGKNDSSFTLEENI